MIFKGNKKIESLFVGTKKIKEAYLGSKLIFSSKEPEFTPDLWIASTEFINQNGNMYKNIEVVSWEGFVQNIRNAETVNIYTSGKTFALLTDIDFDNEPSNNIVIGKNSESINTTNKYVDFSFNGIFDGRGHIVSNLRLETDRFFLLASGIFAGIGHEAIVKNIVFKNCSSIVINSGTSRGGLLTYSNRGKVLNCGFYNNEVTLSLGGLFYEVNNYPYFDASTAEVDNVYTDMAFNSLTTSHTFTNFAYSLHDEAVINRCYAPNNGIANTYTVSANSINNSSQIDLSVMKSQEFVNTLNENKKTMTEKGLCEWTMGSDSYPVLIPFEDFKN